MRWISKTDEPPAPLREFLEVQLPLHINLDYSSFSRRTELRQALIAEQGGLCAFTGVPIDDARIGKLIDDALVGVPQVSDVDENALPRHRREKKRPTYKSHIAHIKPQAVCKQELVDRGLEPGRDLGEDMDHRNMVAALEVHGSRVELFDAVSQGDKPLPVNPTQPDCASHFQYNDDGTVSARDSLGKDAVVLLKLDHGTLTGWRKSAIDTWLDPNVIKTPEDIDDLLERLRVPNDGRFVEYSFCIESVVRAYMGKES